MTTNATKDPGPGGKSEPDLESRIKQRRAELMSRLGELKTDVRVEVAETRDRLKAKLSELAHILNWGVVDGWASAGEPVTRKLEQWLADSTRQLTTKPDRP